MHEQKQIADIKLNLVMSGIPETGSKEQDRNQGHRNYKCGTGH